MQQEQAVVDIHITDGCTRLAIGAHVRQLVVRAKSLAIAGRPNAARDIHLLLNNVLPDAVDGMNISRVARQGSHIGHSRIHIGGPDCVAHGLVLLHHGFVRLTVTVLDMRLSAVVEQELCLVQIFLLARD